MQGISDGFSRPRRLFFDCICIEMVGCDWVAFDVLHNLLYLFSRPIGKLVYPASLSARSKEQPVVCVQVNYCLR